MEGTLSTSDFLALDNMRGDRRSGHGMAATGIGLAAGLGGAALLASIIGWVANNEASKARATGAMAGIAGNSAVIASLNSNMIQDRIAMENRLTCERNSRESWQMANTPTFQSYIDVQANPQLAASNSAVAEAFALASAINNNGLNSAIGTDSFLKVQRYSAPQPCPCDTCSCNG